MAWATFGTGQLLRMEREGEKEKSVGFGRLRSRKCNNRGSERTVGAG